MDANQREVERLKAEVEKWKAVEQGAAHNRRAFSALLKQTVQKQKIESSVSRAAQRRAMEAYKRNQAGETRKSIAASWGISPQRAGQLVSKGARISSRMVTRNETN